VTPLRVGLNLAYFTEESGGAGRYARELMPALLSAEPGIRLTAFVGRGLPASIRTQPWAHEVEWVTLALDPRAGGARSALTSMALQWGALPVLAARRRLHLVHGLANVVPPLSPRLVTVVTLLDLIWVRHPETMNLRGTLGMRVAAPLSARRADRVLAISAAVRSDIVRTLRVDPEKVDVTPLGVATRPTADATPAAELRRRFGLGAGPVVVCVAQLRPHKNLARLVEAHALLSDGHAQLVLVGERTGHESELVALAARLGIAHRVHVTGWVAERDLEGLYRLATCSVLPSTEEGFGLPLLEAMRRDTPVACSNTSSMPEVAGDAAVLFDPADPTAIAAAVDRLLADEQLRARLIERGRARCREFTWEATAHATLASYRRALERA
jgi:glycosyltransferase involved in cell wall biosynthesis